MPDRFGQGPRRRGRRSTSATRCCRARASPPASRSTVPDDVHVHVFVALGSAELDGTPLAAGCGGPPHGGRHPDADRRRRRRRGARLGHRLTSTARAARVSDREQPGTDVVPSCSASSELTRTGAGRHGRHALPLPDDRERTGSTSARVSRRAAPHRPRRCAPGARRLGCHAVLLPSGDAVGGRPRPG